MTDELTRGEVNYINKMSKLYMDDIKPYLEKLKKEQEFDDGDGFF